MQNQNSEQIDINDGITTDFTAHDQGLFDPEIRETTCNARCRGELFKRTMEFWLNTPTCRMCADGLYKRSRGIKNLPCSYRTLHHWADHGLIECGRESENGWRKFSLIEEIWIHIIGELRVFGFPLDKILKCKPLFFEKYSEKYPIPLAEYYLGYAFCGTPVFLLAFNDGGGILLSYQEFQSATKRYNIPNHIRININKIIEKTEVSYYTPPEFPIEAPLNPEEIKLLLLVQMGEIKSITVHKKNGEISRIEATKDCNVKTKIGDLLHSHDYQVIQVKKQNGKIVTIEQTVSIKPGKGGAAPLIE